MKGKEAKAAKAEAKEHTKPEDQRQERRAPGWRKAFEGTHKTFTERYWPNTIITIIGVLVLTPVAGIIMRSPKTIIAGIASGLTLAIWFAAYMLIQQFNVAPTPDHTPILKRPTFQQTPERFSVSIGGNTTMATRVALEHAPIEVTPEVNKLRPVLMYVRNGTLFVDVTFYRPELPFAFEIKNNNYDVIPPDCELNSNEVALEIIDRNRVPILQIIYETPTHIVVNGLFGLPPDGSSSLVIDQKGIRLSSELGKTPYAAKRIFKYPAFRYPGEYEEQ